MDEVDEKKRNLVLEYRKEVKGWFSKSYFGLFCVFQHLFCLKLSEIREKILVFAEF